MSARTVLVVDDEPDIREVVADLLDFDGFAVATAANGQEALTYLATRVEPCVVVLDLMMPVLDGWGFLREAEARGYVSRFPVIVMSAVARIDEVRTRMGVEAILRKPFDPARLKEVLDQVFARLDARQKTRG